MSTKTVRAVVPVLGLRQDQTAELTSSPFLEKVIEKGWLEELSKAEAKNVQNAPNVNPDVATEAK